MSQVLQDVANMPINFERSHGYLLPTFEVQCISSNKSSSSFRLHRQSTKNTQNTAYLEKQHNLIKNFCKKFQDHRQTNKVYISASDDTEDLNNFILEFKNIMLEDSDDSSV